LLWAVLRNEVSREVLENAVIEALADSCPYCREEIGAWERERRIRPADREALARALPALLQKKQQEEAAASRVASRDLRKLLTFPLEERLQKIGRSVQRFRSPALARLLLERCKQEMPADMRLAQDLAKTADAVLRRMPDGPEVSDLWARTSAYLGNSARYFDNIPDAERRFAFARSFVTTRGVTDPAVTAEIDACEAMLYLERRLFRRAEALLVRAICQYFLAGTMAEAAHPLVTLGLVYYHQGKLQKAIESTRLAAQSVNPRRNLRLYVSARFNLALFSCDAWDHAAALEILEIDRAFFAKLKDSYTQLRIAWLRGRIAAHQGRPDEAEQAYLQARDGFIRDRIAFDAALVSLDLAILYGRRARWSEVRRLAGEMHTIFEAQAVHREAAAAVLLFQEAAQQEKLTVERLEEIAAFLKKARWSPGEGSPA
jgi:tetratricopeptide (TPR) repeat protein